MQPVDPTTRRRARPAHRRRARDGVGRRRVPGRQDGVGDRRQLALRTARPVVVPSPATRAGGLLCARDGGAADAGPKAGPPGDDVAATARHRPDRVRRPPRDMHARPRRGGRDLGPRIEPGPPARPAGRQPGRHGTGPGGERDDRGLARGQRDGRRRRRGQPGRAGLVRERDGARRRPARGRRRGRRRRRRPSGVRGRAGVRHRRHRARRRRSCRAAATPSYTPVVAVRVVRPDITPALRLRHPRRSDPRGGDPQRRRSRRPQPQPTDLEFVGTGRTGYLRPRPCAVRTARSSATSPARSRSTTCWRRRGARSTRRSTWPCSTAACVVAGDARRRRTRRAVDVGGRTIEVRADERRRRPTSGRRSPSPPARCWRPSRSGPRIRRLRRSERAASLARRAPRRRADPGASPGRPRTRPDRGPAPATSSSRCSRTRSRRHGGRRGQRRVRRRRPAAARRSAAGSCRSTPTCRPPRPCAARDRHGRRPRRVPARPPRPAGRRPSRAAALGRRGAPARRPAGRRSAWSASSGTTQAFTARRRGARLATLGALVAGTVQRVDGTRPTRCATPTASPSLAEELADGDDARPGRVGVGRATCRRSATPPTSASPAPARPSATGERHVLTDTSGRHGRRARRRLARRRAARTPSQQERLRTAIGLIDETVRRVDIQRSTSETLLSLRQRLLRPLPSPRRPRPRGPLPPDVPPARHGRRLVRRHRAARRHGRRSSSATSSGTASRRSPR